MNCTQHFPCLEQYVDTRGILAAGKKEKKREKKKEEEERRERTNECHGSNEMFRLMQQQQQQQYDYSGKKVCKNSMLIDFIYIYIVNQGLLFVKYQISKMTLVQLLPIIAR